MWVLFFDILTFFPVFIKLLVALVLEVAMFSLTIFLSGNFVKAKF